MKASQSGGSERVGVEGSLRLADGVGIVRIKAVLGRDIDDVWAALADPRQHAKWLGTFEGELRVSGNFNARFSASEWEGTGRVEVCEPRKHLLVSLTETETTESHVMEVTLEAEGEQTVLVVEERGIHREQLAAYGAGVQIHVEDLVTYLSGGERCDAQARWKELFPFYQAKPIEAQS